MQLLLHDVESQAPVMFHPPPMTGTGLSSGLYWNCAGSGPLSKVIVGKWGRLIACLDPVALKAGISVTQRCQTK